MKRCSSTSSCALDTSQKVFALRHSLLVGTKITQNAHDAHSHEQWTSTMNNKQWTVSKYYPAQTHLPFVIVSEKAKKIILPPCSIGTVCHALLLSLCTRCTICQHEASKQVYSSVFSSLGKTLLTICPSRHKISSTTAAERLTQLILKHWNPNFNSLPKQSLLCFGVAVR